MYEPKNLQPVIKTPRYLKIMFLAHGLYFLSWAVIFDFLLGPVTRLLALELPQTMVGWAATDIAAGEILTVGAMYLFAAFQARLPRWVLAVALIQVIYNLYHDAVWFFNGYHFGLVLLDTIVIAVAFAVYLTAWFKAERVPESGI